MKTITTMLVFIAFLFIVINKRLKGKKAASKDKDALKQSDKSSSSLPFYPGNVPVFPFTSAMLDSSYRYDVMVFDYLKYDDTTYFADRVDAALSLTVSKMLEEGYPYRFDFITIGTALLVLVTYQIDSKKDANVQPSSEP